VRKRASRARRRARRQDARGRGRLAAALLAVCVLFPLGCTQWRAARLYQSGTRALEAGEVERAIDDLSQAASLVPQASEIQTNLGAAWLEAGEDRLALTHFERAVELDCDNQAASDGLALAKLRVEQEAAIRRVSPPESIAAPAPERFRGGSAGGSP
jgi:Tfp pilus assembly protein PilF